MTWMGALFLPMASTSSQEKIRIDRTIICNQNKRILLQKLQLYDYFDELSVGLLQKGLTCAERADEVLILWMVLF